MIDRVFKAPVNLFFDVTPTSTIMTRFTGDVDHFKHFIFHLMWVFHMFFELMQVLYFVLSGSNWMIALMPFAMW